MFIVHVFIHVKPECIDRFRRATLANAQNSLREEGIARFDFLSQSDDPNRFLLVEVYKTAQDAVKHKETAHYQTWRETVAAMMAEPRRSIQYENIAPPDADWV